MPRKLIKLDCYAAYTRLPGRRLDRPRRVKTYVPGTLIQLGDTTYKVGKHAELRKVGKYETS